MVVLVLKEALFSTGVYRVRKTVCSHHVTLRKFAHQSVILNGMPYTVWLHFPALDLKEYWQVNPPYVSVSI